MSKERRLALTVTAFLLAGSLGFVAATAATGDGGDSQAAAPSEPYGEVPDLATSPPYPVNENGQTYGSAWNATADSGPDLVGAYGTHGEFGYLKVTEWEEPDPRTPEEALAMNNAGERTIPLYAQDGETVIGEYTIAAPNGEMIDAE